MLEEYRSSFHVYVIGQPSAELKEMQTHLEKLGYSLLRFESLSEAVSEVSSSTPHFVVFADHWSRKDLSSMLATMTRLLPETHFFTFGARGAESPAPELFDLGLEGHVEARSSLAEVRKIFDQRVQLDLDRYLHEQKIQTGADFNFMDFLRAVHSENPMGHFISRLELPNSDTVLFYLRYFSARHLLAVISGKGAASFDGLGIDLNLDPEFRIEQLANPNSMNLIHEFVQDTFGKSFFEARTIRLHDEPIGVLVLASGASDCKNHFRDTWVGALETISSIQHMRLRLQTLDNHCPVTEALSFNGFASAAGKEVARSRRLERPTSVIVIRVDGWFELSQDMNEVQKKNWLRALHRFLVKHSRVNDDVGHLFEGVFGVLLPHTGVEGAKAKADHLRGLIENAELKVGGQIKRFTMSCGVSEYPRRSQDAESLVQSALQAVNQEDLMSNQSYLAPLMAQGSVDFDV